MQWDLGIRGLGLLVAMSLGFGGIAQPMVGRTTTRWLWLIAAAGYFVGGLLISEAWFGWATEADLQPNIDGLSLDDVLLIGLVPGMGIVLATRFVTHRRPRRTEPTTDPRSWSAHDEHPTNVRGHGAVVVTMRVLTVFSLAVVLSACGGRGPAGNGGAGPNPASVYCEEQGGTVEIRTDEAGAQQGICVFDDGSECDEWALYRGECEPPAD